MMLITENSLDIQDNVFNALYKWKSVQTEVNLSVTSLPLNEVFECAE